MNKKRLIALLMIFIVTISGCTFFNANKTKIQNQSTQLKVQSVPVPPVAPLKQFNFMSMTTIASSEVNTDFDDLYNWVSDCYDFIVDLLTHFVDLIGNNVFTGTNEFQSTTTLSGPITINASSSGQLIDTHLKINADATTAVFSCFQTGGGSSGYNNPGICFDPSASGYKLLSQGASSSGLLPLQVANGASGNDATTYQQVPKLATANEYLDVQNFNVSPTSDVAADDATELTRLGEVLDYISAVTVGGSTEGAGAPVGSCSTGAKYYDVTTNTSPIEYYCKGSDGMTWVKVDQSTINSALTINGVLTQAANFIISGTRTLDAGGNKWTNLADPSSDQDALTLAYFNANIGNAIWGDGRDGSATISMNTTLTSDKYYTDLTIDAGSTLTLNGFVVHVSGTLTWNGTINAGTGANASGKTGGVNTVGSLPVINGVNGGNKGSSTNSNITGNAGQSANVDSGGGDGVAGGASNAGGTGWKTVLGDFYSFITLPRAKAFGHYAGSASGDGSIWNGSHASNFGGDGGGSGANGYPALIIAKHLVLGAASTLLGVGGNGANGGNGDCSGDGMAEGGAVGGSGGSGSWVGLLYGDKTGSLNTTTLTGGTKGNGGTGCGGGGNGNNGTDGNAGAVVELDI